jgi:hypothetical protein
VAGGAAIALVAAAVALTGQPLIVLGVAVGVPFLFHTSLESKTAAYFFTLPLVGYLKVRYPDTDVQGIPEVIAAAMALHLGWEVLTAKARLPLLTPIGLLASAFAVSVLIASQNPIITAVGAGISGARVYLSPFVLFLVGLRLLTEPKRLRPVLKVIVITAVIVGAYAMKQLLFGFDHAEQVFQAAQAGSRTIAERKLFSTTTAPDVFSFVAALMVLSCLAARAVGILPRLAGIGIVLNTVGVAASGLRIGLIAVLPAAALLLVLQRREERTRRFASSALAVGSTACIALLLLVIATPTPASRNATLVAKGPFGPALQKLALLKEGSADDDYQSRVDRLGQFVEYVNEHPFGAGPGLVGVFVLDKDAALGFQKPNLPDYILDKPFIFQHDYFYVDVGVELGIIPLVIFILLLIAGIQGGLARWRQAEGDADARAVLSLAVSLIVLVAIHNLTNESFRTPQVAGYIWFFLALPVVLRATRDPVSP